MDGNEDRGAPIPARLGLQALVSDAFRFPGHEVDSGEGPELGFVIEIAVCRPVEDVVHAVPAAYIEPVLEADGRPRASRPAAESAAARALGAWPHEGAVVLEAAGHAVGIGHVEVDGVELGQGQEIGMVPVFPSVPSHAQAVVIAEEHVVAVLGVDPEGVVVAPETEGRDPGLAAIAAGQHADAEDVNDLVVVGVDDNLAVVISRCAADRPFLRADFAPRRAGVVGTIDLAVDHARARLALEDLLPAFFGRQAGFIGVLDLGVEDFRALGVDGQADPAQDTAGKAVRELRPGLAAVERLVDAGARPAEPESPGLAEAVVGGGIKGVRVGRIHDQVDDADRAAVDDDVQGLDPSLAPVGRFVDAALGVLGIEVAQGGHVDDIGVHGVDDDTPDVMGLLESHVEPGLAGVDGLVDAIPPVSRAGIVGFARAQPKDIGIGGGHGDIADRKDLLVLE